MEKTIKNQKTIFIVVEIEMYNGVIFSNNVKAFDNKEDAEYYVQTLYDKDDDEDQMFSVEELTLLELA